MRESPALRIMELLEARGAVVSYHDPYFPEIPPSREHGRFTGRRSEVLTETTLAGIDAALICTDHDAVDYRLLVAAAPLVVDTRNVCGRLGLLGENVVKA
jgi:UDP-N-acetyl-D-glucosamine dehydrogenase